VLKLFSVKNISVQILVLKNFSFKKY